MVWMVVRVAFLLFATSAGELLHLYSLTQSKQHNHFSDVAVVTCQ